MDRQALENLLSCFAKDLQLYAAKGNDITIARTTYGPEELQAVSQAITASLKPEQPKTMDIDAVLQLQQEQAAKPVVVRYVQYKGKRYKLTFDEYGVLDTTQRIDAKNAGQWLVSTNPACRHFIQHQSKIYRGIPTGSKEFDFITAL